MRTNGQRKIKYEEEIDQIDDDGNILLKLRKSSYSRQNLMFRTSKGVLLDFENFETCQRTWRGTWKGTSRSTSRWTCRWPSRETWRGPSFNMKYKAYISNLSE